MSLRRGFKSRANQISVRLRRGQGRSAEAPIDLRIIAERLSIEIVPLSAFRTEYDSAVSQLARIDPGAFSAATVRRECGARVIVHNDFHDVGRQNNSIAHELAHVLLGHPFTYPMDGSGCRNFDRAIEDEASWLGATILISDEAAVHIVRRALDTGRACAQYGVSEPLLRMRINASGARIRVRRLVH